MSVFDFDVVTGPSLQRRPETRPAETASPEGGTAEPALPASPDDKFQERIAHPHVNG